jgi:hypothetical protein
MYSIIVLNLEACDSFLNYESMTPQFTDEDYIETFIQDLASSNMSEN